MSIKSSFLILVFVMYAVACAPQVSTHQATQVIPTASTSTPITSSVDVPKQKEMIFVEFFAGT